MGPSWGTLTVLRLSLTDSKQENIRFFSVSHRSNALVPFDITSCDRA